MKPVTLRTSLTLSYAAVLAVFLTALALAYYHLFARQLDVDATSELSEMTRAVHGYLRFPEGTPTLEYGRSDPEPPAPGEAYLVQVGVPLDVRDAALRRLVALLTWGLPVGLAAVLGAGRWMAGRALAPIAALATTASTIGVNDLHRRLPKRGTGDELDVVADAFKDVVARLEHAVGEMRQFSAAMAHEIRTPLAAIRADLELSLTGRRSPEEQRLAVASQLEEVDKLTRLLAQLLMLARAEAGELAVCRKLMDLSRLTRAVVDALEPVAQANGISLTCECTDDVGITGDHGWMERLLLNLVDNAIKFTRPGGSIAVRVTRAGGTAMLAVQDSGIGIAPDALPHVFDRFYWADASRSSTTDGAGLGLSVVKWIADRHRAVIEVASRPGNGSTFTICLCASKTTD